MQNITTALTLTVHFGHAFGHRQAAQMLQSRTQSLHFAHRPPHRARYFLSRSHACKMQPGLWTSTFPWGQFSYRFVAQTPVKYNANGEHGPFSMSSSFYHVWADLFPHSAVPLQPWRIILVLLSDTGGLPIWCKIQRNISFGRLLRSRTVSCVYLKPRHRHNWPIELKYNSFV